MRSGTALSCQTSQNGKEKRMDNIKDMMTEMMREIASQYEDLGELSEEDLAEWEAMSKEGAELENRGRVLKARGDMFWAELERKFDKVGKPLKIDGGHLYIRREKTIAEIQNEEPESHDPTDI